MLNTPKESSIVCFAYFVALGLILNLFTACSSEFSSQKRPINGSVIDRAYWLIDQGQTEEALNLLEGLDLERYEVRMATATAHMAEARVFVSEYLQTVRALISEPFPENGRSQRLRTVFQTLAQDNPQQSDQIRSLEIFFVTIHELVDVFYRFYSIPLLDSNQMQSVERALVTLSYSPDPRPAERLMRSLISVIVLKYNLTEKKYFPQSSCSAQAVDYLSGLESLLSDIRLILVDLVEGLPTVQPQIRVALERFDRDRPDLNQLALHLEEKTGLDWIDFEAVIIALIDLLVKESRAMRGLPSC